MFHVEFRQGLNQARAFNWTEEQLYGRVLTRWAQDQFVEFEERRWAPDRGTLTIYEGPQLRTDQIGLGRGWQEVQRTGKDVTERVLAEARAGGGPRITAGGGAAGGGGRAAGGGGGETAPLKRQVLALCDNGPVEVTQVLTLAHATRPGTRASERLALAESAIWELVHEGRVAIVIDGEPVAPDRWQPTLLAWSTWTESPARTFLRRQVDTQ